MKPTGTNLLVFAAIADHGSLSAAARHLGIPKSSVSRALDLLEDHFGNRLIERSTRHLRLTEPGLLLLDYAHRIAEEIAGADAAMAGLAAEPAGTLSVTAPHAVAQRLIIPMLPVFLSRYPQIQINIDVSSRVLDLIVEGIDVAIRVGPLAPSSLIARRIGAVTMIVAASPSYLEREGSPQTIADLARHKLIELGSRATPTRWTFGNNDVTAPMTPSLTVDEAGLAREMAVAGLGIVRLPREILFGDLEAGSLVQILPDRPAESAPLYAVYPSRRALAPKVAAFVDALATTLSRMS